MVDDGVSFDNGQISIGQDGRSTERMDLLEIVASKSSDRIALIVLDRIGHLELFKEEEDSIGSA